MPPPLSAGQISSTLFGSIISFVEATILPRLPGAQDTFTIRRLSNATRSLLPKCVPPLPMLSLPIMTIVCSLIGHLHRFIARGTRGPFGSVLQYLSSSFVRGQVHLLRFHLCGTPVLCQYFCHNGSPAPQQCLEGKTTHLRTHSIRGSKPLPKAIPYVLGSDKRCC